MFDNKKYTLPLLLVLGLPLAGLINADDSSNNPPAAEQTRNLPAYLGVAVGPVPEAVQAQLPHNISHNQGMMVMRVFPGSPAADAGLRRHDVLLSLNDHKLISPDDLINKVNQAKPGDRIKLEVLRHGRIQNIEVKLGHKAPPKRFHARQSPHVQVWESFESIAIEKDKDGIYTARVEIREPNGDQKKLEFKGKRDEIRKQIANTDELPKAQKRQLLNAIEGRVPRFPPMPDFEELERQFFAPPPWFQPRWPSFWD